MKKKVIIYISTIIFTLLLLYASNSYALFKRKLNSTGRLNLASWNVHLNQTNSNNSLTIIEGVQTGTYTLSVTNDSQVDIRYSVIISNVPTGVEVSINNGTTFEPEQDHVVSFADVGTILFSDSDRTNEHTLIFRATSTSSPVTAQTVNIDVIAKQIV